MIKKCTEQNCENKVHAKGLCKRHYKKAWYEANAEKVKAIVKVWQQVNPAKVKAANKAWRLTNPEKAKAWSLANPEKVKAAQKAWYAANAEKAKAQQKLWRTANPEKAKAAGKAWYMANPEKAKVAHRVYQKNRRRTDTNFRLADNLRSRIACALRNGQKAGSAVRDLGCSIEYLKKHHLESQFQPGMTWDNYGNKAGCWSIDHIKPLSKFDLTDRQQFLEACHYTNLQPLWHIDNILKRDK